MNDDDRLDAARRAVLKAADGTMGTAAAAKKLGLTPAAVRIRIRRGKLLAVRSGEGTWRLPRAQFDGNGTIDGLEAVLEAMYVTSPWMRIQLFTDHDVLDALRAGRIDDAVLAAESYLPYDRGQGGGQEA